ncbi:MAG: hypothetical protein ACQESA_03775 [Patescibacteria group bacterium]
MNNLSRLVKVIFLLLLAGIVTLVFTTVNFNLLKGSIALLLIIFIAILFVWNIWKLAELKMWLFVPARGGVYFIERGNDLKKIIPVVGGHKLSKSEDPEGRRWIVPEEDKAELEKSFFYGVKKSWLPFQKFLWYRYGIRVIDLWYPQVRVKEFEIDRKRHEKIPQTKEGEERGKQTLSYHVIESPNAGQKVDHLYFLSFRPIEKIGVELPDDASKIDLLILVNWQVVAPVTPVYYYGGQFYSLLDGIVESAIEDFMSTHKVATYKGEGNNDPKEGMFAHGIYDPKTGDDEGRKGKDYEKLYAPSFLNYRHWLMLGKAVGSPMERHLMKFNATRQYYERLKRKKEEAEKRHETVKGNSNIPQKEKDEAKNQFDGLKEILKQIEHLTRDAYKGEESPEEKDIEKILSEKGLGEGTIQVGYAMTSISLVDFGPGEGTDKLDQAIRETETKRHLAFAEVEEAKGYKERETLRGEGDAKRYGRVINSQTELGVDPNVAAGVLRETEKSRNVGSKDSSITHWFEGGSDRPPIAINDTSNKEKKEEK